MSIAIVDNQSTFVPFRCTVTLLNKSGPWLQTNKKQCLMTFFTLETEKIMLIGNMTQIFVVQQDSGG